MKTAGINTSQKEVLGYLKAHPREIFLPSDIGEALAPATRNYSAWARYRLKGLVKEGLVERDALGWYRAVQEEEKP